MQKLFGGNPLICKRETEKTLLRSPNPDKRIHTKYFCLLSSLPLFQTMNSPFSVRGEFHLYAKSHGTGGSGKEWEGKISFYRGNSEIWSVRVIQLL